ncbi:MAG: TIGR04282 family arsenosugar biosynthesis glycosyltransferase [Planctomycetota bacterium]|nr:TIGR04282 family arsenosugar biosynthesis glycosyltransferase [Planctomycetota bacterium]
MSALLLFAKFPAPGEAKTRLIPALGEARAAALAEAMLLDLAERFAREDLGANVTRVLCYTPQEREADFKRLLAREELYRRWLWVPQVPGDLGARLKAALAWSAMAGMGPVAFVGADCVELDAATVRNALAQAAQGTAAIHPARDGGYVLLALPAHTPPKVFDAIPWSTAETCAKQVEALRAAGLRVETGEAFADVDEPADVDALRERLKARADFCLRVQRVLA